MNLPTAGGVFINTGGGPTINWNLPASPATNALYTVVNHSATASITIGPYRIDANTTSSTLGPSSQMMLMWDGSQYRRIGV